MERREQTIDIARGIAIVLMVLGHYIQVIYSPLNFDNNIFFSYALIYVYIWMVNLW